MPAVTCPKCNRPALVPYFHAEWVFTCPGCQVRFYPLRPLDPVPEEPVHAESGVGGWGTWLTWEWIRSHRRWLAAGFGIVVLFLAAGFITLTSWSSSGEQPAPLEKSRKKRFTVDELERLVLGQPKEKVLRAVGRPNRTSTANNGEDEQWEYFGLVYDPTTNKGFSAYLQLHAGLVERVDYP